MDYMTELKNYKTLEEKGLLYRKVFIISKCMNPDKCPWQQAYCDYCIENNLNIISLIIPYSEFDEKKHFVTEKDALNKLKEMGINGKK